MVDHYNQRRRRCWFDYLFSLRRRWARFEVIELVPDKRIRWRHYGEMPAAWMGTEILFELHQEDKQTVVKFRHYNWQQADEFLAHCGTKWGVFMMSMKSSIETGKGQPYPDDIHIDFDKL